MEVAGSKLAKAVVKEQAQSVEDNSMKQQKLGSDRSQAQSEEEMQAKAHCSNKSESNPKTHFTGLIDKLVAPLASSIVPPVATKQKDRLNDEGRELQEVGRNDHGEPSRSPKKSPSPYHSTKATAANVLNPLKLMQTDNQNKKLEQSNDSVMVQGDKVAHPLQPNPYSILL